MMLERHVDYIPRLPALRHWFRARSAIILYFSNGKLEVHFTESYTKIIAYGLMGAVTYVDKPGNFCVYKLLQLETNGCAKASIRENNGKKLMSNNYSLPGSLCNPRFAAFGFTDQILFYRN
ncbi:unnamed protein product [Angiostrongylus costaricensis]|uniref:Polo kinase n=1 Tax=Angiostrongylus costaricensis TaxID=334426 RepID=A0A0R3PWD4_ANGCS|nr:unnamed protein product [Angiostrongylus costaricensis]